jgi:hypothetical protein
LSGAKSGARSGCRAADFGAAKSEVLSAWVRQQSFASLLSYIYQEFPEMKAGSVCAEVP